MTDYLYYPACALERVALAVISPLEDEKVFNHKVEPLQSRSIEELAATDYPFMREFKQVLLPAHDGTQIALWVRPPDDDSKPIHVIFHGRHGSWSAAGVKNECDRKKAALPDHAVAEVDFAARLHDANYRMEWMKQISESGAGVIAVHMRSHGASRHPTNRKMGEERLKKDTELLVDYLRRENIPGARMIIAGESMGGALGAMLAEELTKRGQPPAVLGLITTFAAMSDMIHMHLQNSVLGIKRYSRDWFAKYVSNPLNTAERISALDPQRTNLYIASAQWDSHIPFWQHEKLCDAAQARGFDLEKGTLMLQEWDSHELRPDRSCDHVGWKPETVIRDLHRLYETKGRGHEAPNWGVYAGNGQLPRPTSDFSPPR